MEDTKDILGLKLKYGLVGSIGRRCIKMRKDMLLLVRVSKNGEYITKERYAFKL
jgi:hypothetical protein